MVLDFKIMSPVCYECNLIIPGMVLKSLLILSPSFRDLFSKGQFPFEYVIRIESVLSLYTLNYEI